MTTDSASVIDSERLEENNDKCWTSFSILRTQTKLNIAETISINLTNILSLHVSTLTSELVLKSSSIRLALLYGSIFARKSLSCCVINYSYFEIRSNIDTIFLNRIFLSQRLSKIYRSKNKHTFCAWCVFWKDTFNHATVEHFTIAIEKNKWFLDDQIFYIRRHVCI